jgi:hypothetical protein
LECTFVDGCIEDNQSSSLDTRTEVLQGVEELVSSDALTKAIVEDVAASGLTNCLI